MTTKPHVEEPDDDRRCQASTGTKQCTRIAEEGSTKCSRHGGDSGFNKAMYVINNQKARERFLKMSGNDHVYSLKNEIALTRVLIEERFNAMNDTPASLLANCGPLNQLLLTSERLIKTSNQLDFNTGEVVGRGALLALAKMTSDILLEELRGIDGYEEIIDRVGTRMFEGIMHLNNNTEQKED